MPTVLSDLLRPALRMAGITRLPGTTPSVDQFGELVPEVNRMIGSWNLTALNIFHTSIEVFPLVAGQTIYTIGPGGDFDTVRPQLIKSATILLGSNPSIRLPGLHVTTDSDEWERVSYQEISAIPRMIYNDRAFPLSSLYFYPQDSGANSVELYTWNDLAGSFTAVGDAVSLPPGYEDAIVTNFAVRVAMLYPLEAKISEDVRRAARQTLARIQSMNAPVPVMTVSYPGGCGGGGGQWPIVMGGGFGGNVLWIQPLETPDGVRNTFSFRSNFTWANLNGLDQFPGIGYNLTGFRTLQFIDYLGNVIVPDSDATIRAAAFSGPAVAGGTPEALTYFAVTGAIDGTDGSDGNAVFTLPSIPASGSLKVAKNGIVQIPNVSYTVSGLTVTFLAPNIPIAGDSLLAWGSL